MISISQPPFLTALALVSFMVLPIQSARAGTTLERVQRTHVMNGVLLNTYPPFSFIDAKNQLAGFDVDVARAVAQRLGVALHLETPVWDMILSGRWQGRWDVCICSLSPTGERARTLSFPVTYYSSPAVLTVHAEETRIKSVSDVSGRRVGVGLGSSYENYVNKALVIPGVGHPQYPFHDVIAVPGDESINFRNLALGPGVRLDAIVSDLATAQANINATHKLKIVGDPLYAEPNVIATEKGDEAWDETLKRVILALKAEGVLARISQQWFGKDITLDAH